MFANFMSMETHRNGHLTCEPQMAVGQGNTKRLFVD